MEIETVIKEVRGAPKELLDIPEERPEKTPERCAGDVRATRTQDGTLFFQYPEAKNLFNHHP